MKLAPDVYLMLHGADFWLSPWDVSLNRERGNKSMKVWRNPRRKRQGQLTGSFWLRADGVEVVEQ